MEWGSFDAVGTLTERTIRASGAGGAVVAVQFATGGLIRLLPNRQGNVIGWLRPDGKLGDAYGNSPQAGAGVPAFRYAGMRFNAETGLYHTPNRAYDPDDGRWMQRNVHGNGTRADVILANGHMGYEPFASKHQGPFDQSAAKLLGFK